MPRFLVEHHHTDETCPTNNPDMVRALASHVSSSNAEKMGVNILSDAVVEGEHTLLMVVEADSRDKVDVFAAPFMSVGPTTVKSVVTCEIVASRFRD